MNMSHGIVSYKFDDVQRVRRERETRRKWNGDISQSHRSYTRKVILYRQIMIHPNQSYSLRVNLNPVSLEIDKNPIELIGIVYWELWIRFSITLKRNEYFVYAIEVIDDFHLVWRLKLLFWEKNVINNCIFNGVRYKTNGFGILNLIWLQRLLPKKSFTALLL